MKAPVLFVACFLLAGLLLVGPVIPAAAQSGIYVGGHFRRERSHTIADLKASGFTYVILFNINVEPNGDLTTDGETVCEDGRYVFGQTSPHYAADVAALTVAPTSITRVETCVGGWGNHSYTNIRNLIAAHGADSSSILYRNFRALKVALPTIEAVNNDDEEAYDAASATAFHVLLADVGFKTTLAPYRNRPYWLALATAVNQQRPGAVDKLYLQWYEGGARNNPCDWSFPGIELQTGDLSYENPAAAAQKMRTARTSCHSQGGFFWVYNDNKVDLQELARRINVIYGR